MMPALKGETYQHPTGGHKPRRVCLVALGPTCTDYLNGRLTKGTPPDALGAVGYFDETWTINRGIRAFPHDVAWVLDDLANEAVLDPDYGHYLRHHDKPIITTRAYAEFRSAVEYPIRRILKHVGRPNYYLHNSVPMILAYAHWLGVEELVMYGVDYTHARSIAHEDDRANAEYWVGWCRAQGMRVGVPNTCTLLNAHRPLTLYGYLAIPEDVYRELRGW